MNTECDEVPSCEAMIYFSQIATRPFCKIELSNFDLAFDEVQHLLNSFKISFEDDTCPTGLISSLKNYYYYGNRPSPSMKKVGMRPRVQLILSNMFFEKYNLSYKDIEQLMEKNSCLPLLYTRIESDSFRKFSELLCRLTIRSTKYAYN